VRADVRPQIYVPYTVFPWGPLHYVVRSASDPAALAASVRSEADALGAGRAVFKIRTLDSYLAAATSSVRLTLALEASDEALVVGEAGMEHLERDLPIQRFLNPQVQRRHAAGADLLLDLVARERTSHRCFRLPQRSGARPEP
jgi:hypothetical protein